MKPTICFPGTAVRLSTLCRISKPRNGSHVFRTAPLVRCGHFSTSIVHHDSQDIKTEHTGAKSHQNGSGSLSQRHCLVTGGASGIGYEITKSLLLNGASNVTITSRDPQKAKRAIDRIKADINLPNAPLHFVECDFEETVSLDALKRQDENGKPPPFNTLINCAGITQSQSLISTPPETTSLILKTNLEAPIELSRQFLKDYFAHGKLLTKQTSQDLTNARHPPSYCIIIISSLLANRGGHGTSIYSTSKAALTAFTRTLALEASAIHRKYPNLPPFRANVVVPGYIDTPMISAFSQSYRRKLEGEIPLGRYGSAAEVADAVLFLVGNEYANNCVVNLDGGLSAV